MEHDYALYTNNGNILWADAKFKEMKNVRVTFKKLPDGRSVAISNKFLQCNMVFDMKMEHYRGKAQLVAGGDMTEGQATYTYASVVSRETVRIALMIAALDDFEVSLGDILNTSVQAPATEELLTNFGPEFGKDARKTAVIVKALFSLKSAVAAFRATLPSAWSPLDMSLARLTWIYGLN